MRHVAHDGLAHDSESVLTVLRSPADYHFKSGVWYAINVTGGPEGAAQELITSWDKHTLSGRMGCSQEILANILQSVGLGTTKEQSWRKVLRNDQLYIYVSSFDSGPAKKRARFIAFGSMSPLHKPEDQLRPQSMTAQPAVASKSVSAVRSLLATAEARQERFCKSPGQQLQFTLPPQPQV